MLITLVLTSFRLTGSSFQDEMDSWFINEFASDPVPPEEDVEDWFIREFESKPPIPTIQGVVWQGDGEPFLPAPYPSEWHTLLAALRREGPVTFRSLLGQVKAVQPYSLWRTVDIREKVHLIARSVSVPRVYHDHFLAIVASGTDDVESTDFRLSIARVWPEVAPALSLGVFLQIATDWVRFCIMAPQSSCHEVLYQNQLRWILNPSQILFMLRTKEFEASQSPQGKRFHQAVHILVVAALAANGRSISDEDLLTFVNSKMRFPFTLQQVSEVRLHFMSHTRVSLGFHRTLVSLFASPDNNPHNTAIPDEIKAALQAEFPLDYELRMDVWFTYCIEPLRRSKETGLTPCYEARNVGIAKLSPREITNYIQNERSRLRSTL